MSHRALIADPSVPVSGVIRKYLEAAGFQVRVVHHLDEAAQRMGDADLDIVFAAATPSFDGETLCQRSKAKAPNLPVVLVYPPEEEDPEPHAAKAGADAYLVGPIKRATVVSCARSMMRIRTLQTTVEKLESDLKQRATHSANAATEFDFFKKFLLMEVKRSRRYRYPVAFLLVALDHFAEKAAHVSGTERTQILAEALRTVARCVRDIDLAVPFGDERFLVFLPHTPREGAMIVAGRLRDNLASLKSMPDSTASVGVASFEPGGDVKSQVSFGSLMKDATEALRKAQAQGGNAVEGGERKARDRISLG